MKRLNEEASCLDVKVGAQQEQHKASRPRPRRVLPQTLPQPKNLGTSESGQKTTVSYGIRIMLCLRHGTAPHANRKTAIQAIKDLEEAETAATGRLHACCAIQSSVINGDIDDTTTNGYDMSESMYASKSNLKEPPTLMAQSICKELDRDQFSELNSSDAPANNIELDIELDIEVVEPELEPVTKKKKTKRDVKDKDKVPITNLRDEIRANCQKILNLGGCLKVEGQLPNQDNHNCMR